jgi:methyl-accepting chemotaxis protein
MGCGIAQVSAEAGVSVVLIDVRLKSLAMAMQMIGDNLNQKVAGGAMTPDAKAAVLGRIVTGTDFNLLSKCSFCIEVVLENAEVKSVIHSKIRKAVGPEIVIASNTANLCIETLSQNVETPENFMGMVFAYPPLTALDVKLIRSTKTSTDSVVLTQKLIRAIGKNPIMASDRQVKHKLPPRAAMRYALAFMFAAMFAGFVTDCAGLTSQETEIITGCIFVALALLTGGLAIVFEQCVVRLTNLINVMAHIASDDLSITVPYLDQDNAFGKIGRLLDSSKMISIQLNKAQAEEEEKRNQALGKLKLTDEFNQNISHLVGLVASESDDLQAEAKNLTQMADQASRESSAVAAATEEASVNVQTVAAAAEELAASIGEINRQVEESASVSLSAVDEVKRTNSTVATLSEAAAQIGDVVKLIQDIAAQTNLLALNATIEAARAGEAGKGFAVVAGEVKSLADQTRQATEEISKKIDTVQSVSVEAAKAIHSIGTTIERISSISETIARAIQQQTDATREISKNVQQATMGTSEVSAAILKVTNATAESRGEAEKVLQASQKLSQQAEHMRGEIESFLKKVKL